MASLWLSMDIDSKVAQDQIAYYQTILKSKTYGDWEDPTQFHITLDYLGKDETDFEKVVEAMKLFEKENTLFNQYVFANKINRFDGGALWMGVDECQKLYDIHYAIEEKFKQVGYQKAPDKFEGYTPHITLAFNTPEIDYEIKTKKIPVPVTNITLWNSFKVNGQYVSNYLYKIDLTR